MGTVRVVKINPLKNPKNLKKADKDKISNILKNNQNILTKDELRIFKKELKDV
jgi:hypothetical protein